MERRGIKDPDSREGVDCCLNCGLGFCEIEVGKDRGVIYRRKQQARQLAEEGLTLEEIAKELIVSVRTVRRYLA